MSAPFPKPDNHQYQHDLIQSVFAVLAGNGSSPRGVYDMSSQELPKGGIKALLKQRPFDAVRCEIGGTTLTVEITPDPTRHGEQSDPDAMRYGTYDLNEFKAWFYNLLRRSGMTPRPSGPVGRSAPSERTSPRSDLKAAPFIGRRKRKGGGR